MEQEVEFDFPVMKFTSFKDMNIDCPSWTCRFGDGECAYQEDKKEELFDLLKIWKEKN